MDVLRESVIRGEDHHQSEERECYEVARDLRRAAPNFANAIADTIPGGRICDWPKMSLVDKIVMVFTDTVSLVLIRPGPTPEDRQAHDLVTEAAAMEVMLEGLIAQVIAVDDKARGLALAALEDSPEYGTFG